jgi:hypothetical protein
LANDSHIGNDRCSPLALTYREVRGPTQKTIVGTVLDFACVF